MTSEFFSSFSSLALRYDAFILDLWGVIHDGQNLYPGAKECLEQLRASGKKIVLLSNAPRRAFVAAGTLERMGITDKQYDALVSSGEAAFQCLSDPASGFFHPAGNKYIYIGLERDRQTLAGLSFIETDNPAEASFVLLAHSYYDHQPMSELEPLLKKCLAAKLPALCINPDPEVVRLTGERVACAGVIAEHYKAQGGEVVYFGKPHHYVYEHVFKVLAGVDKSRMLAVGDTLATDIKGAVLQGIANVLVTGGVLKAVVGSPDAPGYAEKCEQQFAEAGVAPDFILSAFNW